MPGKSLRLLGADVGGRSADDAVLVLLGPRQAEVGDERPQLVVDEDVLGLRSRWSTPCSWA
jgi:hypothetical protein